jgi:hypothetical protein
MPSELNEDELPPPALAIRLSMPPEVARRSGNRAPSVRRARQAVQKLAALDDGGDLRIGFTGGDLIMAIARGDNSFEVTKLGQRLAEPGRVQAMVEQFAILFDVVDEFGLQPPAAGNPPMPDTGHTHVRDLKPYRDVNAALKAIGEIYEKSRQCVRDRFEKFLSGAHDGEPATDGCYPYLGVTVGINDLLADGRPSYGSLPYAGTYGTTLTRPDLFADYYREQIELLLKYHAVPVHIGVSDWRAFLSSSNRPPRG